MKCHNCYAIIPDNSVICPYCDAQQFRNAEKKYMSELEDIHDDLEDLDIEGNKTFWRGIRLSLLLTLAIIALMCFIGAGKYKAEKALELAEDNIRIEKLENAYTWYDRNVDKLDELYAKRDFEGITSLLYELENYDVIGLWEHYDISIFYREKIEDLYEAMELVEDYDGYGTYSIAKGMASALEIIYEEDLKTIFYGVIRWDIDEEESQICLAWKADANTFLYEILQMSDAQIQEAREICKKSGYYGSDLVELVEEIFEGTKGGNK